MALDYKSPNARLARELEQVSKEAGAVAHTLRGINLVPRRFPSDALNEICIALSSLKDGTAEGCHEPLNFARYMLPLVRRDHFQIEGEVPDIEDEEDTYFTREHPLDLAITRLYAAVGTALDEYRAQAQDTYDDYVGPEETIELGDDGTFLEIDHRSKKLAQTAIDERNTLSEMVKPESEAANELTRQIQDSANIAHSIQSQIRIRPTVVRWIRSADAALRRLPDVIIATAEAIKIGTDVAKIWVEEWSAFNKRLRVLTYDSMYGLARALQTTGERLKQQRRGSIDHIEAQRDPEIIAAERRVKSILLAGEVLPQDIARKAEILLFQASDGMIRHPSDLAQLENLRWLSMGDSVALSDVSSILPQIPKLTELQINAGQEQNISSLGQLPNLRSLILYANRASDISALGRLSKLTRLTLNAASASDVTALGELANLTTLVLWAESATDVSAIGQLTNLTKLTLYARGANDFSELGRLSNLVALKFHARTVSDWSFIAKLHNLTSASLSSSFVDLACFRNLSKLRELSLTGARDLDVSHLAELKSLKKLRLNNAQFRNLSLLKGVKVELLDGSEEVD